MNEKQSLHGVQMNEKQSLHGVCRSSIQIQKYKKGRCGVYFDPILTPHSHLSTMTTTAENPAGPASDVPAKHQIETKGGDSAQLESAPLSMANMMNAVTDRFLQELTAAYPCMTA